MVLRMDKEEGYIDLSKRREDQITVEQIPLVLRDPSAARARQVGRQEPVMVLRVDKEKGYIDLSKRRVSPEDIAGCEERYNRSKLVHGIVGHVAETCGVEVEELYTQVAWPLYKMYGHAFEAFKVRGALWNAEGQDVCCAGLRRAAGKCHASTWLLSDMQGRAWGIQLCCGGALGSAGVAASATTLVHHSSAHHACVSSAWTKPVHGGAAAYNALNAMARDDTWLYIRLWLHATPACAHRPW